MTNILNITMPDFKTRRDAFDALLKPTVPFPEGWVLSWEKPERFTCHCCGFPTIMEGMYLMCNICWWEQGNYHPDVNYDDINEPYMLFDSRKHFEENGSMFIKREGFDDFERAIKPTTLAAKRELILALLNFLDYPKNSKKALDAWQDILRLSIALTNTNQGDQLDYDTLLQKLKWRKYPIAIKQVKKGGDFEVIVPDLPGCTASCFISKDSAACAAQRAIRDYIQALVGSKKNIPEPSSLEAHYNKPEFKGWTWAYVQINHQPRLA